MNRKPRFEPSSSALRIVFAAIAIVATLSTGAFIDALASGLGAPGAVVVATAAPFVGAQGREA
jgi:hypothetical protein